MNPGAFFASPGGVFFCSGGVTGAGGWRSRAAGVSVGRGDGSGLTGTVATGGGGEVETCFGRSALAAGVGCTAATTGTIGDATTPDDGEVVGPVLWWLVLGTAGA